MKARARFLPAPAELSGCLFGAIHRDTRGAGLDDADRLNHFPASPMVAVTRIHEGGLFLVRAGGDWRNSRDLSKLDALSVALPSELPLTSWSPGDVTATTLVFYPDAWRVLGGGDELPDLITVALLQPIENVDAYWARFCDEIAEPWRRARFGGSRVVSGVQDWARGLQQRAFQAGRGQSIRAIERRLKRLSGQTQRQLNFFASFENTHRVARENPDLPPAEIALEAGYSDQSHLGRAVRRATGFSPVYLNRAIETQEAFWCYRLLGERF